MSTQFLIIDDGKIVDGELLDREGVIRTLPHCGAGAKVLAFDLSAALSGRIRVIYDATIPLVREAHGERAWTRAEIEGSPLLSSYIELPVSREEQRADDADARRFEG